MWRRPNDLRVSAVSTIRVSGWDQEASLTHLLTQVVLTSVPVTFAFRSESELLMHYFPQSDILQRPTLLQRKILNILQHETRHT